MIESKKIFIDTAPIIYYLQSSELYYANMKEFWKKYNECDYVTSTITIINYDWKRFYENDSIIDRPIVELTSLELKSWARNKIISEKLTKTQKNTINTAFLLHLSHLQITAEDGT